MPGRTKIVATLAPNSSNEQSLGALIEAGVDVFRLNFSHGTADEHRQRAVSIRKLGRALKMPVGILCDMQGPKIRIGRFAQDRQFHLENGGTFYLDSQMPADAGNGDGAYIA